MATDSKITKDGQTKSAQDVNVFNDSPIDVFSANSLITEAYDYISAAYPNSTTETYTYKSGGASGTLVAIVTVVYTDATKDLVSTVTRT